MLSGGLMFHPWRPEKIGIALKDEGHKVTVNALWPL